MKKRRAPSTAKEITIGDIAPGVARLKNSIPVYLIQAGSQPVIRMDITFRAGSWWQDKPLVASSTIAMLSEGTSGKSSGEIAETIDYHGAYLNSSSDRDNAWVSVYFLDKHLDSILPLVAEIIMEPSFPEQEFQTYVERRRQSYLIEKNKVSNLAREQFNLAVYGKDHPYGSNIRHEDFSNLTTGDLGLFHSARYNQSNCRIIVSGNFDETRVVKKLDYYLGGEWGTGIVDKEFRYNVNPSGEKRIFVPKNNAVQSALRIGRELFGRAHPRYPGMLVLNNLLGGHFGSRLMQNIREKKGYTYGIGSVLVSLRYSGFFVIVSEVGTSYWEASIKEIHRELDKLANKPVSKRELDLTRTRMLGDILREFDGPFARAETVRNLVEQDLDTELFNKIIATIRDIRPDELLDLAGDYLASGSMYEVIAGSG